MFEDTHHTCINASHIINLSIQILFHTKSHQIKIFVIITVKNTCMYLCIFVLAHLSQRLKCEIGVGVQRNTDGDTPSKGEHPRTYKR